MTPYYQNLIAKGLCTYCGKRKPREGRRMCPQCALKVTDGQLARQKEMYRKRNAEGLCIHCGVNKADAGYASCAACREKNSQWHKEYYRRLKGETV